MAHNAPRCIRCKTRYCDATCQHDHWRRGHKQICKRIHRGGNAEQYNADKKYKEAVAVAVEDTGVTLDDLREAVTMLEDTERVARRVLGGAHPHARIYEKNLRYARALLRARETPLGLRVVGGGGEKLVNDAVCNPGDPNLPDDGA